MEVEQAAPSSTADRVRSIGGSWRVESDDATSVEVAWESSGRISVVERGPDGECEYAASFDPSGVLRIVEHRGGHRTDAVTVATSTRTNPYGMVVEREEYPHFVVERTYDDDARPCHAAVRGDWGELAVEVHADGSRTVRWALAAIDVEQHVHADGVAEDPLVRRPPKEEH